MKPNRKSCEKELGRLLSTGKKLTTIKMSLNWFDENMTIRQLIKIGAAHGYKVRISIED